MNSTSTASSYTDDPPPYHSVAGIAGISPRSRGRLLSRTSVSLQPCVIEEPPPSYETVITSLESCEVRIIPQNSPSHNPQRTTSPCHNNPRRTDTPRSSRGRFSSDEADGVGAECSVSQTSTTSEDVVYSTGSATSINTSPARDPLLPDVVNNGTIQREVTDMTDQTEQNSLLKDSYIERATSL